MRSAIRYRLPFESVRLSVIWRLPAVSLRVTRFRVVVCPDRVSRAVTVAASSSRSFTVARVSVPAASTRVAFGATRSVTGAAGVIGVATGAGAEVCVGAGDGAEAATTLMLPVMPGWIVQLNGMTPGVAGAV